MYDVYTTMFGVYTTLYGVNTTVFGVYTTVYVRVYVRARVFSLSLCIRFLIECARRN